MKLKQLSEVELELLSLQDLAELILEENKTTLSTADIFKHICELKGLSEDVYNNKIGDFYTSLMTDKRFIMLALLLSNNPSINANLITPVETEMINI